MSVIEEISRMSKSGCDDNRLMNYIQNNFDILDCELNGDEYEEPKNHSYNFCIDCNNEMLIDYQKSILVSTNCGLCEYYPAYVRSYDHTMKTLRSRCIYKRSDSFEVILNQFFYGGKQLVPDDFMNAIRNEIHNSDIKMHIKEKKRIKYKNSIYYIFFPYITTKEYNMILNVFNVVSSIYDKYKPKGRKSFFNYFFCFETNVDNAW